MENSLSNNNSRVALQIVATRNNEAEIYGSEK